MFRSTIAPAKRDANAATMSNVQTVSAIVAATNDCTRGSSERMRAASNEERGERDHRDVEVELGEVPERRT